MSNIHKVGTEYPPFISSRELEAMLGLGHEAVAHHIRNIFESKIDSDCILEMTLTDAHGRQSTMYMVPQEESKALVEAIDPSYMDTLNSYWSNLK